MSLSLPVEQTAQSWRRCPDVLARHEAKVQRVAHTLRNRPPGSPVSIRKRAVSHQVPKRGDLRRHDEKIDLIDLDEVLAIDPVRQLATAEPGVTFTDLVRATARYGLAPIIVPELRTITIGGAVSGCSVESMSFRHGGFHDTCTEYEVVTGQGKVLHCTPDNENHLVFEMMHGSFGTLGLLTKLTFKLTPVKPYVRLVHHQFGTVAEYERAIAEMSADERVAFLDGFVHSPSSYVLSAGTFEDEAPYTNRYDWTKVYFQSTATRREDYLRLEDYYFRYDNGVTNVHPKSFVGRLLFGRFLSSARLLRIAEVFPSLLPEDRAPITLDTFLPASRMEEFIRWYHREFPQAVPLWVVPYRRTRDYPWIAPSFYENLGDEELFIDLAIYGMEQRPGHNDYRVIEEQLRRCNGIKTLISHNYYSEEEFWQIFNRSAYQAVKQRTDPDNIFRDLWKKTCKTTLGLE